MDFELSEEQRLLQDSVRRLLASRAAGAAAADGFDRSEWQRYAELGLLGLPFAERHGGIAGGTVEIMIVMEEFGRALAGASYLASVVLGGGCVRLGGTPAMQDDILPQVAAGRLRLAFAHGERQARYALDDVATRARADGADFILDGEKTLVSHGGSADRIVVSARLAGERRAREGLALFLIDAGAPGVARRGYATIDGGRAAEIGLSGVRVTRQALIGEPGRAYALIERVVGHAIAALCAEATGGMAALHAMTVDYLKTRRQFGVPIGTFQALQHRAADMLVALEQARSMAMYAAMMADDPDADARRAAIAAAKVQIGRSARFIGQQAIQLHGGIGMTMEYKAGHYFKRLTAIDLAFGDADHHLGLLAALPGIVGEQAA